MILEKKTIFPTIKVNVSSDDDISVEFNDSIKDNVYSVVSVQEIPTKAYGLKTTMTLLSVNDDNHYNVFLNNVSTNNLIDSLGSNTDKWTGKKVKLFKETDNKYNKDMIVVKAQ